MAKTRWLASTFTERPTRRARKRAIGGIAVGEARARCARSRRRASSRARPPGRTRAASTRGAAARRFACSRARSPSRCGGRRRTRSGRCRRRSSSRSASTSSSGSGRSTRLIVYAGTVAQRHRVERAQRADPRARREQRVVVGAGVDRLDAAVGQDQLHGLDLRREVLQAHPGAVRRGRDRAGDRLVVDVALVLHREAVAARGARRGRRCTIPPSTRTRPEARLTSSMPVERLEAQHHAVGAGGVGERVPASGDAHAAAGGARARARLRSARRGVATRLDRGRAAALVAGPVAPFGGHGRSLDADITNCTQLVAAAAPNTLPGGGVAERFNAAALKAVDRVPRSGGSNPSPSAHLPLAHGAWPDLCWPA